jgi:hypothetical protein
MAVEYVPYIGDELKIHPLGDHGRLDDTEVFIEVVWQTN